MSKVKTVELDGVTFYIHRMDPFEAMEVFGDLQKLFAGPLAALLEAKDAKTDEEGMQAVMHGIEALSTKLDGKQLMNVCDLLLFKPESVTFSAQGRETERLTKTNKGMAFEHMADIVALVTEVLKHNYADFLSQMVSRFGLAIDLKGISQASSEKT